MKNNEQYYSNNNNIIQYSYFFLLQKQKMKADKFATFEAAGPDVLKDPLKRLESWVAGYQTHR